MAEKKNVYIAD